MKTRTRRRGYTLIELVMVTVFMGLLASLVVPQFTDAGGSAMESAVKADLRRVRSQIELYHAQHHGAYPVAIKILVQDGYLNSAPKHSGLGTFEYDAATGEFWSTQDPTW